MKFNATTRSVKGSSASRRLRRAGRVPGIVYGGKEGKGEAISIELDHNEIYHALRKQAFHASILEMNLDGTTENVLLRAVQWHAYKPQVLHIDFQRIVARQLFTTKVPFNFINGDVSPAVKLHANTISHVMTEIEIECFPRHLPQSIEVDLSTIDNDGIVHLSSVVAPEGVTFLVQGDDPVIAVATPPKVQAEEDSSDEAAPESTPTEEKPE